MTKKEFKKRVLPVRDKLYRLAFSLLSDRQETEDTLQDVFVKLWSMRQTLDQYRSLEALTVTMTKNLCLDKLRSYRHRKQDDNEVELYPIHAASADPASEAELSESSRVIHRFVQMLPNQQRLVMHLRDIEQYSYEEIEEVTGLTRNNIRVQLSRGRKKVRKEYIKYQEYEYRKS